MYYVFFIIIIPRALPHYHVDVLLEYRNGIQRHYRYLMSYVTAKVSTTRVFLIIYNRKIYFVVLNVKCITSHQDIVTSI